MKLAVEGAGYRSACQAFVDGNQQAARVGVDLVGELAAYAGMAGDDATATEFAETYDDAASAAVEVLAELVGGFASLARLAEGSLRNHVAAEQASTLPGWPGYASDPPAGAELCSVVHLPAPASALGGDSSTMPGWANTVLDLLEGVFWPDADTDRLRAAAATWRSAADSVGLLAGPCSSALAELSLEVSPEIPLAVATTEDLRARVESLAGHLRTLATACDEYAAHVDAKRAEMLDLLEQLAWELGIGAVVSGILTGLTGGAAAPAAGSAGAARVAAASARLRGILGSLGLVTRSAAATLRPVGTALRDTRAYLTRLSAARTERGSASLGSFFAQGRHGLLGRHEGVGLGHTMKQHVGKPAAWLHARVVAHPTAKYASSFTDEVVAERAVFAVLRKRRFEIEQWLDGAKGQLVLNEQRGETLGIAVDKAGNVFDTTGLRVVLARRADVTEGFIIRTSYPMP